MGEADNAFPKTETELGKTDTHNPKTETMFDPMKPYVDLPFLPPRKFDHESKAILKQLSRSKVELAKLDAMLR